MSLEIGVTLAAIVALLLLSAFFNGSETSLTAASRARMHKLEEEGDKRARLVNRLLAAPEKLIGAVLLGNTLVDVLAAALAVEPGGRARRRCRHRLCHGHHDGPHRHLLRRAAQDVRAGLSQIAWGCSWRPLMRGIVWLLTPATLAVEFIVRQILKITPSKDDDAANLLSAQREIRGTDRAPDQGGDRR